jgi:hypothetical protein
MKKRNQIILLSTLFIISITLFSVFKYYIPKSRIIESKKELQSFVGSDYTELASYFGLGPYRYGWFNSEWLVGDDAGQIMPDNHSISIENAYYVHQDGAYCALSFTFVNDTIKETNIIQTDCSFKRRGRSFYSCLENHIERHIKAIIGYKAWRLSDNEKHSFIFSLFLAITLSSILVFFIFPKLNSRKNYVKYLIIILSVLSSLLIMSLFNFLLEYDTSSKTDKIKEELAFRGDDSGEITGTTGDDTERKDKYKNLKKAVHDKLQNTSLSRFRIVDANGDISFKVNGGDISWDYPLKLNGETILEFLNQLDQYTLNPSNFLADNQKSKTQIHIENKQGNSFRMDIFESSDDHDCDVVKIDENVYKLRKKGFRGKPLLYYFSSSKKNWEDLTYLENCLQKINFISELNKYDTHLIDNKEIEARGIKKIHFYERFDLRPLDIGALIANVEIYYDDCAEKQAYVENHKYFQRIIDGAVDENYLYIFANGVFHRAQYFSFDRILFTPR